ncbi:MAG: hypothetical protein GX633_10670 [Clostridiales bacterium]|nr:hypothetical protein [Clostridiales bacterium]
MSTSSCCDVILKNDVFTLVVGSDAVTKSLTLNSTGEELFVPGEEMSLFSVTQDRPFNNEVKLAHPNKRTTYQANSLKLEGNLLRVTFEIVPVKAVIELNIAPRYIGFKLKEFVVYPEDYGHLSMKVPPVAEFRLCQLPVKNREKFGEWLNVVWDDTAAVNVLAVTPQTRIDSERRARCRVLTADAVKGLKLEGCEYALIASEADKLMDAIDAMERYYSLPLGVESRKNRELNRSIYWTHTINPKNVDEHIAIAKKGNFKYMLIYYPAFFESFHGYGACGNYDYNKDYPNGKDDLIYVLDKLKAAGITPGFHFLQTHIGLRSRYVTPKADHRLGKTRYFTLARPLLEGDTELYVEENPAGSVLHPDCRILQFGGELISYENFVDEVPYRFTGIVRGALDTILEEHPLGQIGGILDVSEFSATSCYLDQNSSLQDEIAEKLADAYNCGFRFCYMDGSEGTNIPYEFHVANSQYRVYKLFKETPIYVEGAAKSHFGWHFQSGGNAFDIFPPPIFKKMIARFPAEEAPRMRCDFTRVDFGWWGFWCPSEKDNGTQADMYEYGTSRAAAWNCPVSVMVRPEVMNAHPRIDDILEVIHRWEDVRDKDWLTEEQIKDLQNLEKEHTLLINENGDYELFECEKIDAPKDISAFLVERGGKRLVIYWHETGAGEISIKLGIDSLSDKIGGDSLEIKRKGDSVVIPAENKRYLVTSASSEEVKKAFAEA